MQNELPILPAHARYAPSAAGRWVPCNASVNFSEDSSEPKAEAQYGTEVHAWIAAGDDGDTAEWPVHWTEAQRQDALTCLFEWDKHVPDDAAKEVRLTSLDWPDLLFGTADAIWIVGNTCHVADLKTGFRGVNAVDNMQLAVYALLASECPTIGDHITTFVTHIVQPRRFYYGQATYTREQLAALKAKVRSAIEGPEKYEPGTHCEFCPARMFCPALHDALSNILNKARHDGLWKYKDLTWKT